jgi:hypothetical protein
MGPKLRVILDREVQKEGAFATQVVVWRFSVKHKASNRDFFSDYFYLVAKQHSGAGQMPRPRVMEGCWRQPRFFIGG